MEFAFRQYYVLYVFFLNFLLLSVLTPLYIFLLSLEVENYLWELVLTVYWVSVLTQ